MDMSYELVTPEQARHWLENHNTRNRKIREKQVEHLAREILCNRWKQTHQGIAFATDGTLLDGQHRLSAIVMADKAVLILVVRGVPKESQMIFDEQARRSTADSLTLAGQEVTSKEVAIARMMMQQAGTNRVYDVYSKHEYKEFLEHYLPVIQFVTRLTGTSTKNLSIAPVQAAFAAACTSIPNQLGRLAEFGRVYRTGVPEGEEDQAVVKLRDHLMTNSTSGTTGKERRITYLKTQSAIKAFLERRSLSKLIAPNRLLFSLGQPISREQLGIFLDEVTR